MWTAQYRASQLFQIEYRGGEQDNEQQCDVFAKLWADKTCGEPNFMNVPKDIELVSEVSEKNKPIFFFEERQFTPPPNSKLSYYCYNVLKPLFDYMKKAYLMCNLLKHVCIVHGGLCNPDGGDVFKNTALGRLIDDERALTRAEVSESGVLEKLGDITPNELHRLGVLSESTITGRIPPSENATDKTPEHTFDRMDEMEKKLLVVGHTPQNTGIPTIIRRNDDEDKFIAILDTQYSSRVDGKRQDAHCFAFNELGEFRLEGYFYKKMEEVDKKIEYVADSTDKNIGIIHEHKGDKYRIVAKMKEQDIYIATNHDEVKKPKVRFVPPMKSVATASTQPSFTHAACGDIEGSRTFLDNFLTLKAGMEKPSQPPLQIVCVGDVIGDPMGKATMKDEAYVIDYMKNAAIKLIGNRDINKLRLIDEFPIFQKNFDWGIPEENEQKMFAQYMPYCMPLVRILDPKPNYYSVHQLDPNTRKPKDGESPIKLIDEQLKDIIHPVTQTR